MLPTPSAINAKEARDQRVFDAVRQLLSVQGLQLSMDAVAAQAGCSKQTLYSRYGSKRDLLRQVMHQHALSTAASLSTADGQPLRTILLDFAIGYLEHRNQPHVAQTSQLIVSSAHEFRQEAQTLYQGSAGSLLNHLVEWIEIQIGKGRLIHDDPHFMAELLLSMIAGLDFDRQRFHAPHRDDAHARRRWAEFSIDCFLRAFMTSPDSGMAPNTNTPRSFSR